MQLFFFLIFRMFCCIMQFFEKKCLSFRGKVVFLQPANEGKGGLKRGEFLRKFFESLRPAQEAPPESRREARGGCREKEPRNKEQRRRNRRFREKRNKDNSTTKSLILAQDER